jgi:hypothetical protein
MTTDATDLMAEALKRVSVSGSFSPEEIGKKVGMTKLRSEAAARALSNAGVLVLGFDCAAHFSTDFRKARAKNEGKPAKKRVAK